MHHAQHLQRSYNKYGEGYFSISIITECDRESLIAEEQKELDLGFDYNSSPTAGNTLGFKFSKEARERVSWNRRDRYAADPEGYSAMMSSLSKGKPKSTDWRKKMSDRLYGVPKGDLQKERMARSRAELSKDQVLFVRECRSSGMGLREVADKSGVSWSQCQRICAGERYQWAYDYSGPVEIKKAPEGA